ncbi:MAG TPA: glutathione S-transferase family protein [Terriglobia bacterium]|nr:glutathione S-transferase family protein [Terriglobia bacterium]
MEAVTVFGARYSVYVRSVRLALEEKQIPYRLEEVDVFAPGGPPPALLQRHPFGRIPAFEHRRATDTVAIYETAAILRYVDEAFDGPALQPHIALPRARMNQVLGILDNYAYRCLVWDIYVERVSRPAQGRPSDEARIASALPQARTCLRALAGLMQEGPWFTGPQLTLADLHAASVFAYFVQAAEAPDLLAGHDNLCRWWAEMSRRDSMIRTPFESGE